jgi:acyl dehydratase
VSSAELIDAAYERAVAGVGKVQEIRIGVLDERALQRFSLVVGHTDPAYADEKAAKDLGYDGLLAAPLYLSAVLGWDTGPAESDLLADGNSTTPLGDIDVAGLRLMGGGQDLTFHEPVVAGLDVVMHAEVTAVTRKEGRSGPLLVIEVHRRYLEADGRLLVECHESFLAR